jgi:hypothetical protein
MSAANKSEQQNSNKYNKLERARHKTPQKIEKPPKYTKKSKKKWEITKKTRKMPPAALLDNLPKPRVKPINEKITILGVFLVGMWDCVANA